MKLHLTINEQNYYLGQMHQRQCDKTFQKLVDLISSTLTAEKVKYRHYQLCAKMKNVQSVLYTGNNLHVKLLSNNDDYVVEGQDISNESLLIVIPDLIKQVIKHEQS